MKTSEGAYGRIFLMTLTIALAATRGAWAQKATEKMAEDREGFRKGVVAIRGQIDSTLSAMNAVVEGKDAKARKSALKKYGDEVKAMGSEIEKTRDYADKMRERGKDFFKDWEKSMKSVKNESLKASANERRTTMQAQYDKVENGIKKAKEISPDFWKNLQDLEKYFANDMSDNAIATSSELVKKTNDDGKKIQAAIDDVVGAVDEIGKEAEKKAEAAAAAPAETAPPAEGKTPEGEGNPQTGEAPDGTKPPAS